MACIADGRFTDVECRSGDVVALGEPGLAFRITTVPSERQRSAVDAALALLPSPAVRASIVQSHHSDRLHQRLAPNVPSFAVQAHRVEATAKAACAHA